jgi:hypothetical protein
MQDMNMKLKATLIATVLLLSAASAQASLVETDWNNLGDGLATLDTDTGIEWLDLTQTLGMSINQAEGLLGSTFDGWRLPTGAEVTQMMVNAFPSVASQTQWINTGGFTNDVTDNEAGVFRGMFGVTYTSSDFDYSWGMFKNDSNIPHPSGNTFTVLLSGVSDSKIDNLVTPYSNASLVNDYNYSHSSRAVYLVSDGGTTVSSILDPSLNANNPNAPETANVSAPILTSLLGFGLLGFATRRRSSDTSKYSK